MIVTDQRTLFIVDRINRSVTINRRINRLIMGNLIRGDVFMLGKLLFIRDSITVCGAFHFEWNN